MKHSYVLFSSCFQESFKSSKLAFRHFKLRVRKTMSPSLLGLDGAEAAAVDYIVRNMDLHDIQTSVNVGFQRLSACTAPRFLRCSSRVCLPSPQEVIGAMNVNPRISFPPEVDFVLISTLIRETCRVAFAMQTLDPPPDLAFASDGELYDDRKSVLRVTRVCVRRVCHVCV